MFLFIRRTVGDPTHWIKIFYATHKNLDHIPTILILWLMWKCPSYFSDICKCTSKYGIIAAMQYWLFRDHFLLIYLKHTFVALLASLTRIHQFQRLNYQPETKIQNWELDSIFLSSVDVLQKCTKMYIRRGQGNFKIANISWNNKKNHWNLELSVFTGPKLCTPRHSHLTRGAKMATSVTSVVVGTESVFLYHTSI